MHSDRFFVVLHNELLCLHNNILDLGIDLEQFFVLLHNNILSFINELLGYNMILGVILGDSHSNVWGCQTCVRVVCDSLHNSKLGFTLQNPSKRRSRKHSIT